jgi:uncharacterized SAM-binding protein YcdF (DUF218 family)
MILLVTTWFPVRRSNVICFEVEHPGDYAIFNSSDLRDDTVRSIRYPLTIALLIVGFGAGAWLEREALLRSLTDLWIVSDPITRGDAVVVLGGGLEYRPFVAADLYKKGLVSKVLVSRVPEGHIGALLGHTELNRRALLRLGVPDAAIEMFGTENRNTEDEVLALKDWAEQNAASVLIVPSEIFAARRVRWIFNREFHGIAVRIEVPSFEEDFTRAAWWKTKAGLIAFQTEVLKYIYYRIKGLSGERFSKSPSVKVRFMTRSLQRGASV